MVYVIRDDGRAMLVRCEDDILSISKDRLRVFDRDGKRIAKNMEKSVLLLKLYGKNHKRR